MTLGYVVGVALAATPGARGSAGAPLNPAA